MELREASVAYQGDIRVLQELSIRLAPGRITGIIGPNGAGKSTALKTLYGLLRPIAGEVRLGGRDVTGIAPWQYVAQGVSLVPQGRSVFADLTVEDNLMLSCWIFRRDRARVRSALEQSYAHFPSLGERRRERAGSLSGGQQRFLELARGLVSGPSILLLDEPTAMIAPKVAAEIYDFIHGLPARGVTVLLVDQNVRQCVRVADYLYVLELGRNRAEGEAGEFRTDEALRGLIGEWVNYRVDTH
jgi:branched-chain amino acid transport system ATP-binding protein